MTPRTPGERIPEERLIISTAVYFCTLYSSWSAFQMEPPAKLNAIRNDPKLLSSFLFLSISPFLSFKQTYPNFFLFLSISPFMTFPFPLLHKKVKSFLSSPFSFPIPTFLYFIQTKILFLSTSHFLTILILISYFLSFFISLIWTYYFLFPLPLCYFSETIFPFSVSVFGPISIFPFNFL